MYNRYLTIQTLLRVFRLQRYDFCKVNFLVTWGVRNDSEGGNKDSDEEDEDDDDAALYPQKKQRLLIQKYGVYVCTGIQRKSHLILCYIEARIPFWPPVTPQSTASCLFLYGLSKGNNIELYGFNIALHD